MRDLALLSRSTSADLCTLSLMSSLLTHTSRKSHNMFQLVCWESKWPISSRSVDTRADPCLCRPSLLSAASGRSMPAIAFLGKERRGSQGKDDVSHGVSSEFRLTIRRRAGTGKLA